MSDAVATITTTPALPLPGKPVKLAFTATAAGNLVKVWCTAAPQGSALRAALDEAQSTRVAVIGESDIDKQPQYTFDRGGAYVLEVEEFTKGAAAYGGRYAGDPDSFRTEEFVANDPATLNVASLIEIDLGVSPDLATLQLYVSGTDIKATTPATHGFSSPGIVRPKTDKARAAADASAVLTALAALGNVAASSVLGVLRTHINNWIQQFNSHAADTAFHANADTDNAVAYVFRNPHTLRSFGESLAECAKRFGNHIRNVDPGSSTPDPGSASYHESGGNTLGDWDNALIAAGGSTMGACLILYSDLQRCYTAHQAFSGHTAPDENWNLDTQSLLVTLHAAFLSEIAAVSPTAPANEHPAKVLLVSGAGAKAP